MTSWSPAESIISRDAKDYEAAGTPGGDVALNGVTAGQCVNTGAAKAGGVGR